MILALVLMMGSCDVQAQIMLENPYKQQFVSRRDAIVMDDCPELRKALKRRAIEYGVMDDESAPLFDRGFGASAWALGACREAIALNKLDKRKID